MNSEARVTRDRIAVALDTADWSAFRRWCSIFGGSVGVLKVGLEAYVRWGAQAVEVATATGSEVFLDLKLHDIPNTVAGATRAAADLGVRYLTVHVGGGERMVEAAVEAAGDSVSVLGVTVLTHLDEHELAALDWPGSSKDRVRLWAGLAHQSGCAGVVCSPLEVGQLRHDLPRPFRLVTPGIRPAGGERGDQRRVSTPEDALAAGADLLVIGRPLTAATDPAAALESLLGGP